MNAQFCWRNSIGENMNTVHSCVCWLLQAFSLALNSFISRSVQIWMEKSWETCSNAGYRQVDRGWTYKEWYPPITSHVHPFPTWPPVLNNKLYGCYLSTHSGFQRFNKHHKTLKRRAVRLFVRHHTCVSTLCLPGATYCVHHTRFSPGSHAGSKQRLEMMKTWRWWRPGNMVTV